MGYDEDTKRRCISLRRAFSKIDNTKSKYLVRCRNWSIFVNKSSLSDIDKKICIKEFLNPKDLIHYKKG